MRQSPLSSSSEANQSNLSTYPMLIDTDNGYSPI